MRLGFLGDLHAEDERLERALEAFRALGADRVVAVGDIADGVGDLDRTCSLLRDAGVHAIRGNHDRWLLDGAQRSLPNVNFAEDLAPETLAYLGALPGTLDEDTPMGTLLVCHGLGENDLVGIKPWAGLADMNTHAEYRALVAQQRYTFVLAGHTHERMVRAFGGMCFVNAGSLARWEREACFGWLDFDTREVCFRDFAEDHTLADLTRIAFPAEIGAGRP